MTDQLREKITQAIAGWGIGTYSLEEAADAILREIEALPPVGEGEEKGMGPEVVPEGSRSGRSQEAPSPGDDEPEDDGPPLCSHGVIIFGDRVRCEGCELEMWYWGKPWPPKQDYTFWSPQAKALHKFILRERLAPPNQNGGLSSATDNGSATPLGHEQKTPSPTTPLGAEDLERAARAHDPEEWTRIDALAGTTASGRYRAQSLEKMRTALLALGLPVEPGQ